MSFGIAASVLGAVGTIAQVDAAKSAASKQARAARNATELQREMFEQTRSDQAPFREAGYSALAQLQNMLGLRNRDTFNADAYLAANPDAADWMKIAPEGMTAYDHYVLDGERRTGDFWGTGKGFGSLTTPFTGADLASEPGYQFGLNEGIKARERSAAARGGLYSGATLKALERYGQDYGGTKFNEAFNRDQITKNTLYNQLSGVSGTGQTATNQVGQAGQAFGNAAANNIWGAANAGAAGSIARGNIVGGAANQLAAWLRQQQQPAGVPISSAGDPLFDPYGQLGGPSTAGDYSDKRLKTNIRRLGTTASGHGWYRWDWKTGGSAEGVIAQEVLEVDPSAVSVDADGILRVDYSKV